MAQNNFDLVNTMEDWFKKAPALPASAREFLVMVMPWIALVFGILGVLGSLAALGLVTAFSPLLAAYGVGNVPGNFLSVLLGLLSAALLVAAFPGTRARKAQGWRFLFWSEVASVVASLVALSVSGIIFAVIAFYILFQIKSYYK